VSFNQLILEIMRFVRLRVNFVSFVIPHPYRSRRGRKSTGAPIDNREANPKTALPCPENKVEKRGAFFRRKIRLFNYHASHA
jgi:hypothetical protein